MFIYNPRKKSLGFMPVPFVLEILIWFIVVFVTLLGFVPDGRRMMMDCSRPYASLARFTDQFGKFYVICLNYTLT